MKRNAKIHVEGNSLFKRKLYPEAIAKYSAALQVIDRDKNLSILLIETSVDMSEMSLTSEPVNDNLSQLSLLCLSGAFSIDPSISDAVYYRNQVLNSSARNSKMELLTSHEDDAVKIAIAVSLCLDECFDDILLQKQHADSAILRTNHPIPSSMKSKSTGNGIINREDYVACCNAILLRLYQVIQSEDFAPLLCNRSLCFLYLSQLDEALLNAVVAVVCDPTFIKAHYRRAAVLLSLEKPLLAAKAVACGLRIDPDNKDLINLQEKIQNADVDKSNQQSAATSMDLVIRNRLSKAAKFTIQKYDSIGIESDLTSTRENNNRLANYSDELFFPLYGKFVKVSDLFDRRIKNFPNEFVKSNTLPSECDLDLCLQRLSFAYECARSYRGEYIALIHKRERNIEKILCRLRSSDLESMTWYFKAGIGEVNLLPNKCFYDPRLMHCFSNAVNRAERLEAGTTHVAIGFVDLGLLREAQFDPTDGNDLLRPTRWVGFESAPYCVAKTIVIASMLKMSSPVDCILQVWYSSAWSLATLTAFRSAVTSILSGPCCCTGLNHQEVRLLLVHWETASVTLAQAMQDWLGNTPSTMKSRAIGNFTKKSDRVSLCSYFLTGQLLPATVGSVTFFSFPPNYWGKISYNQHMFESLPLKHVIRQRELAESKDIVSAAINYLQEGIHRLQEKVVQGSLVIDIRLLAVEPSYPFSLAEVAALDPCSISWSNVCDYYSATDFHAMARACSGPTTIHHAYSMNWLTDVKGTFLLDYVVPVEFHGLSDESLYILLATNMPDFYKQIDQHYRDSGFRKYLLSPPVECPSAIFEYGSYCRYRSQWIESFFSRDGFSGLSIKGYLETEMPLYSPFSQTTCTIYFTFSYLEPSMFNHSDALNI